MKLMIYIINKKFIILYGSDKLMKKKRSMKKSLIIILFMFTLLVTASTTLGVIYLLKTNGYLNTTKVVTDNISKSYVDLGNINVNLADEGGKRYFKGQVSVGYSKGDKIAIKSLANESKLVVVKDVINFYFKSKDAKFISNPNNELQIKTDLITFINDNLQDFKITDIRFRSFIVQ